MAYPGRPCTGPQGAEPETPTHYVRGVRRTSRPSVVLFLTEFSHVWMYVGPKTYSCRSSTSQEVTLTTRRDACPCWSSGIASAYGSPMSTTQPVAGLFARLQADRSRNTKLQRVGNIPSESDAGRHEDNEPFGGGSIAQRLNWLRAGVLGANDGIVSISGLLVGVAAASPGNTQAIAIAGSAGIVSAALSMAVGEYVSVSTQRDTERQLVVEKQQDLTEDPERELDALALLWEKKGLSSQTSRTVAAELSARDAVSAHLTAEHNIDPHDLTSPWAAALSSLVAFVTGSALPFLTMLAFAPSLRIPATIVAVMAALAITGWVSAWLGEAPRTRAVLRLLLGGAAALALTYTVGHVFGVSA